MRSVRKLFTGHFLMRFPSSSLMALSLFPYTDFQGIAREGMAISDGVTTLVGVSLTHKKDSHDLRNSG